MRNIYWIPIGLAAGLVAGAMFGMAYVPAGAVIGLFGGIGIWIGMSRRRITAKPRTPR